MPNEWADRTEDWMNEKQMQLKDDRGMHYYYYYYYYYLRQWSNIKKQVQTMVVQQIGA